ncbi:hypothetical protein D1AOALGA4SA_972 [Olavius algarvensis Delta 1 endosymbiont]|nr:hypothetical protein D1AOALGA4SA_972 [Olavius algarvensis Delta 1 endosymbiont]
MQSVHLVVVIKQMYVHMLCILRIPELENLEIIYPEFIYYIS